MKEFRIVIVNGESIVMVSKWLDASKFKISDLGLQEDYYIEYREA